MILYAYKEEPDMRKQILMKGNILELQPDRMTLVLRNGQQIKTSSAARKRYLP